MPLGAALQLETMTWPDALTRVCFATACGFLLGYDRGAKNKPVDFRVFMIVAVATCLLAMMGQELTALYGHTDTHVELGLLRIVQGVLTGIGFLGAGAIIKPHAEDNHVIGTATGASIWGCGALGLMVGFGLYALALIGFVLLAAILILFGYLKRPLFDRPEHHGPAQRGERNGAPQ